MKTIITGLLWLVSIVSVGHAQPTLMTGNDVRVYGFKMHYTETGSGPPIILLHGLWGGLNEWRRTIPALSQDFRVIVLDQIGFHESDKPEGVYHNALLAQFLAGFIETLRLQDVTLMGHAMGANTATYTAVHYPHLVGRLVLVDGAGYRNPNRDPTRTLTAEQLRFRQIATGSTLEATRDFLKLRVYDPSLVTERWTQEAFAMWLNSARAIRDMMAEGGDVTEEEMRTIKAPTLIVWGREDRVFPPDNAERLHTDIAGSFCVIFEQTGHLPQLEKPDPFNRVVHEFLTTGKVSQQTGNGP